MNIWHIIILLISVLYFPKVLKGIINNKIYMAFIAYVFVYALIELIASGSVQEYITIVRRLGLFYCSFSIFVLLSTLDRQPGAFSRLNDFFLFAVICTSVFGFYQLVARELNLPFGTLVEQSYRKRFYFTQMTSFFFEPRFYGSFLICCLHIVLYQYCGKLKKTLLVFILSSLIFTMSITSYVGAFVVLAAYFLQFRVSKFAGKVKIHYSFSKLMLLIVICSVIFFPSYKFKVHDLATERIELAIEAVTSIEVEKLWERISSSPLSHLEHHYLDDLLYRQYSFYISTFGELSFIVKVLKECPLTGFGIGYDKQEIERTMGLNAFAEFMVRWGVLGTMLFVCICLHRQSRELLGKRFSFLVFILIFCSSHGSIAEPFFWFCLSLVIVYQKLHPNESEKKANGLDIV